MDIADGFSNAGRGALFGKNLDSIFENDALPAAVIVS